MKITTVLLLTFIAGKTFAQANLSLSNLTSPTAINQSLLPGTTNSKNLGSSSNQWQYFYLYGRIYLNGILTMHGHGTDNLFVGPLAGNTSITGTANTGIGSHALFLLSSGYDNDASGYNAMFANNGYLNEASGSLALFDGGVYNTATGDESLSGGGNQNTANGAYALASNNGSYNTGFGSNADFNTYSSSNTTVIGYNAIVDASDKVLIGNSSVTSIGGQVGWTVFSDGRYKKNIIENVPGLSFINKLQPVTYTVDVKALDDYNKVQRKKIPEDSLKKQNNAYEINDAADKIVYTGFIAQQVEEAANQDGFNFSGVVKPQSKNGLYGLRYSDFIAPLIKAVQQLSAENSVQDSTINELQKMNLQMKNEIDSLKQEIQ